MTTRMKPEFNTRLFTFFKCESARIEFPKISYSQKSEEKYIAGMEQTDQDKSTLTGLNVLHPQARKLLASSSPGSVKLFRLVQPLQDELSRSIWQTAAPKWAIPKLKDSLNEFENQYFFTFSINAIRVILFPTGIVAAYIEIEPGFDLNDSIAASAGKMILNALYRMKNGLTEHQQSGAEIRRVFSDERQQESVMERMGKNEHVPLTRGLCGESVSLQSMVNSLFGDCCVSLMGNRFITNSFLKTSGQNKEKPFSNKNLIDLIRLARSESDHYLPEKTECQEESATIRHTFENVVFAFSGEGVACWVKPGMDQEFLQLQFKERFQTIYLQLFLLALHQRYALVDLAHQLDESAPSLDNVMVHAEMQDKGTLKEIEETGQRLRRVRSKVANFYLHAFFHQPAILTNHQQFYRDLQQVLGVNDLLSEVQKSTTELDYIISDIHQKKLDALRKQETDNQHQQNISLLSEIRTIIGEQERSSRNELILTLVVEFVGIPYYLHSFLVHAFDCPNKIATGAAVVVTLVTMGITVLKFWKKDKE